MPRRRLPLPLPPPLLLLLLLLLQLCVVSSGARLSDFVLHYDPVQYDRSSVQLQLPSRVRRDASRPSPHLRIRLQAPDREFRLLLRPDRAVFSPDVVFESDSGPVHFDTNSVYTGYLEDDEDAVVQGIVKSDGTFDGSVKTASDEFFIEPSSRYLPSPQPFHSLIYRLSDVRQPARTGAGCASQRLANRTVTTADVNVTSSAGEDTVDEWLGHSQLYENLSENVTTDERILHSGGDQSSRESTRRSRRSTVDLKKTTCTMYLQADHLFYEQFGSEEACIDAMIRHVQAANEIYKTVDFDRDGTQDNIGFMIKRVRVHKPNAVNEVGYRYEGNYGVEKYLEIFSEENYDSFCLAYMFTYRDFEGGTLGLAWTGDLNQAGGVCEKNGFYRGSKKSLNTGIISILNYGKRVPPAVSHVTFAHEIGHNFGSQHDPDDNKECTPGGEDGNYIMYARATSGDKRNNNRFSPCSLRSINPVLRTKARSSRGCFVEPQSAICGNGVVEEGEQCDCGWEEDCKERCCTPMSVTPLPGTVPCRLTPAARCSPSQGPCCNDSCEFGYGMKCRDDNGCRAISRCNGRTAECPPSIRKPDRTICNEHNVCFKGECSGSICLAYGLESCQCDPGPGANRTKACELCCKRPGPEQPCISSFEWNSPPFKIPDRYSRPGTPCNQYRGYCDVFQQCREVDPIGPLATLKDLLLSDKSLSVVKEFMDRYWYMIVLGMVIIILSLIAVIRIFGKSPPTRSRRRHRHRDKKRTRQPESTPAPLPDVAANAAATDPLPPVDVASKGGATGADAGDAECMAVETSERGRQPLKRRVDDVKRAAAKARRAASHMALSSRASVASGVARVMETGRRGGKRHRSHTAAPPDARKRRRKEDERRDKSRGGHRRTRDKKKGSKENVRVISYTNLPAEVKAEQAAMKEAQKSSPSGKTADGNVIPDVDKRKSLPADLARRKATAPTDVEKRRSLPKAASPDRQARQESPSKQRRPLPEGATAEPRQSPERSRRHGREPDRSRSRPQTGAQVMGRSSSQRQRSSHREQKKRSRSNSPTKRQTSKPAGKSPADDKHKKKFTLHMSPDNVISEWLGRNAKKQNRSGKATERVRKKPIVPTAPMDPNDQVLQWLQRASHEPGDTDCVDGMVSPQATRRSSLTSDSAQRRSVTSRPGAVRSRGASATGSTLSSGARLRRSRDTASSAGASERRRQYRNSADLSRLSAELPRPGYRRSRSYGTVISAPVEERLSFRPAGSDREPLYDLPRGNSPERIYDIPNGSTPERSILGVPRTSSSRQTSVAPASGAPSVHDRSPDRQLSVPAPLAEGPASPQRLPSPDYPQTAGAIPSAGDSAVQLRHPTGTERQQSAPGPRALPPRTSAAERPLSSPPAAAAAAPTPPSAHAVALAARPLPEPPLSQTTEPEPCSTEPTASTTFSGAETCDVDDLLL